MKGDGWMSMGLSRLGGEESHSRFGGGNGQPPVVCPRRHLGCVGGEGSRGSHVVRGRVRVRKVVGVGGSQLGAVGVGGNVKVEEDRGYTGALRDSCAGVSVGGGGVVVAASGHPSPEVGGQPANRVVLECCLCEGEEKFCVWDRVESFRKINRHGHCSVWWPGLVEARGHFVCEGEECCGGVVSCSETVLCGGEGEGIEFWKEEPFQNFGGGTEEGNGAVSRP